ncbi:protein-disulfide reductase DsbD domain-containing protein [Ferrovibrio sp.]|uniref:protein-disulfide reductase DsbD domain-containing protein n=1 Tax=Ferrovibrio sp. TaxID=1917215 RepID=UPI003515297C
MAICFPGRRLLLLLAFCLLPALAQAQAQMQRPAGTGPLAAAGMPGGNPARLDIVQGGGSAAGLRIRLAPGWKFYWRTPGEGGVPPRFDWSGSRNLTDVAVAWPAPQRIGMGDTDLYGYIDEVILPLRFERRQPAQDAILALGIEYGICKDICILREESLSLRLDGAGTAEAAALGRLAAWQAKVPQPAAQAGITLVAHRQRAGQIEIVLAGRQPFRAPDLLVEGAPEAWFGRPQVTLSEDRRTASFLLPVRPASAAAGPLVLTLIDGDRAAELTVPKS